MLAASVDDEQVSLQLPVCMFLFTALVRCNSKKSRLHCCY